MGKKVYASARRAMALLLLLSCLLPLTACTAAEVTAASRLFDLLSLYGDVPAGETFATAGEGAPLDPDLLFALYARDDAYLEYEGRVAEAAVYLGCRSDEVFEAAVFLCHGSADVRAIAEMCHRRARLVQASHVGVGEAVVAVNGRTVVMLLTKSPEAARRAVKRLW